MLIQFLISVVSSQICPIYECASLSDSKCISPSGFNIQVDPCTSPEYCPTVPQGSASVCQEPSTTLLYSWPGEPCVPQVCAFGYCNGTMCIGSEVNIPCKVSDECQPGLACLNGVCNYLIRYGYGPCLSDFDCANSAGCMAGVCTKYFSISEAYSVPCVGNSSNFCKTGACYEGFCLGNLTNDNGEGSTCQTSDDCTCSSYSMPIFPVVFNQECMCGMDGKKYCALFSGDVSMRSYRAYLAAWINSNSIALCSTVRRFALPCIKLYWDAYDYAALVYYQIVVQNYTQIISAKQCALDVYFPVLGEVQKEFVSFAMWIGAAGIVFSAI